MQGCCRIALCTWFRLLRWVSPPVHCPAHTTALMKPNEIHKQIHPQLYKITAQEVASFIRRGFKNLWLLASVLLGEQSVLLGELNTPSHTILRKQAGKDMKRKTILLFLSALLLSLLIVVLPNQAKAENAPSISFPSGITLYSPLNTTYNSQYLTLNLTLYSAGQMGQIDPQVSMNYSIDGKYNGSVPLEVSNPGLHVVTNAAGLVNLPKLSVGSHCLTIHLLGRNQVGLNSYSYYLYTVYFSIRGPPKILLLSPTKNATFEVTNIASLKVPLNFTVDNASQLSFSLDGQLNATITGNYSLTDLPSGLHNVTVYAWDSAGNVGVSENVNFTITVLQGSAPEFESFILPLALSVVSVVAVAAVALIYSKKRKRQKTFIA